MLKDSCQNCVPARLCPCSFGIAIGITNAIGVFLLGLIAMYWGYGASMVTEIASVYHGYAPTYMGSLWGGLWALVDGFVFGVIVALIYNCCSRCCCRKAKDDVMGRNDRKM